MSQTNPKLVQVQNHGARALLSNREAVREADAVGGLPFTLKSSVSRTKRSRDNDNIASSNSHSLVLVPTKRLKHKRLNNHVYPPIGTFSHHLDVMGNLMESGKMLVANGIHKAKLRFNSDKDMIDSTHPTVLAHMLVHDPDGTKTKFKVLGRKHARYMLGSDEDRRDDLPELFQLVEELAKEETHSSIRSLAHYIHDGTKQRKSSIEKNKDLLKECDLIIEETVLEAKENSESTATETAKLLLEYKQRQEGDNQELLERQRVEREQLFERQRDDYNLKKAELEKTAKDSVSQINSKKVSIIGIVGAQKKRIEETIKQQEEELDNFFILGRSHVKVAETGLHGLKKALAEGAQAAQGYLMAVLKMQKAIKSGDLKEMKKVILDADGGKE